MHVEQSVWLICVSVYLIPVCSIVDLCVCEAQNHRTVMKVTREFAFFLM